MASLTEMKDTWGNHAIYFNWDTFKSKWELRTYGQSRDIGIEMASDFQGCG